ncbi:MAG: hypothetical protein E4H36_04760 [Spirochaetales bacterium]|nr:MAG: hypothetical protein E4H36_04760 [Spirochaetales bacterium]
MKEKGIVTEITDRRIKLAFVDQENCESCGSKLCTVKDKVFFAANTGGVDLHLGDTVEVNIQTGGALSASFMVLMVPLILFILFFAGSGLLFHVKSDGIKALFGLAGLAIGFLVSLLSGKRKMTRLPEIIGKVAE